MNTDPTPVSVAVKQPQTCRCDDCGATFEAVWKWPYCPPCDAKRIDEESAKAQREAQEARRGAFWSAIPPLYRATDRERLAPELREIVAAYEFSPRGVGFIGTAGAGKTRAAILILERLMELGMSTLYLPATDLAAAARGAVSETGAEKEECRATLAKARKVKALLLDDLGKGRLTDRAESELYDILEHRTAHMLPTFWTSNSNAKGLREMMSADRADALIRRLGAEFCQHVTL
jgi:DNA replication protein DnaC